MRVLFLFLDGVGLGEDEPAWNPFAVASLPNLLTLLEGHRIVAAAAPFHGQHASLLALDSCLGVGGLPQSATGQAVLITGQNIPQVIGYHYGPKPDEIVARFLKSDTLFHRVQGQGKRAGLLNAYPDRYFMSINSGRRLYSAIPLAVTSAGFPLSNTRDLRSGDAISADFTGQGWHDRLGMTDIPIITHPEAGARLASLSNKFDFAMFEYWPSDYAGHGQDMNTAVTLLEQFDAVIHGLMDVWDFDRDLILITSDHGNIEDLRTRHHTPNPVPCLLIGNLSTRLSFSNGLQDITGITPAILKTLQGS